MTRGVLCNNDLLAVLIVTGVLAGVGLCDISGACAGGILLGHGDHDGVGAVIQAVSGVDGNVVEGVALVGE